MGPLTREGKLTRATRAPEHQSSNQEVLKAISALTIKLCGKCLPLRMGASERRGPSRARARVRAGSFRGWKATEVAGAKNVDFDTPGVPM